MTSENPVLLLDTNIWIDNYFGYRPESHSARELIAYADAHGCELAYAATSSKDVFFLAGSELKRLVREERGSLSDEDAAVCSETAWGFLKNMTELAVAIPIGEPQIWLAMHYRDLHNDFEDNLMLAATEGSGVDFLVTNDKALFGKAGIPIMTSKDMLLYLKKQHEDHEPSQ